MRVHLRYRHIKHEAVRATEVLFTGKPWRLKDADDAEEILNPVMQAWADEICRVYDAPHVAVRFDRKGQGTRYGLYTVTGVRVDSDGVPDGMQEASIDLGRFSLTNLFWHMGEHLASNGKLDYGSMPDNPYERMVRVSMAPFAWACSLFYICKPVMFRARVREGRIAIVAPEETYSEETLRQFADAGISPSLRNALDLLRGAEAEAVSLDEPPVSEVDQLAEANRLTVVRPVSETTTEVAIDRPNGDALRSMDLRALREYAVELGITGSHTMSKDDLLTALGAV